MGKSWEIMGKSWENHGNHGKIMGKSWENHGKSWEHHGKIMGKSWENMGKSWENMGYSRYINGHFTDLLEVPTILLGLRALQGDTPQKSGLIWYSTSILGS